MTERRTDEEMAREFMLWMAGSDSPSDEAAVHDRLASAFASLRAEVVEECARFLETTLVDYGDGPSLAKRLRSLSTPGSRP